MASGDYLQTARSSAIAIIVVEGLCRWDNCEHATATMTSWSAATTAIK